LPCQSLSTSPQPLFSSEPQYQEDSDDRGDDLDRGKEILNRLKAMFDYWAIADWTAMHNEVEEEQQHEPTSDE
jgi:hypothetical protein